MLFEDVIYICEDKNSPIPICTLEKYFRSIGCEAETIGDSDCENTERSFSDTADIECCTDTLRITDLRGKQ